MSPKEIHILLVEDSEIHAELIRDSLFSWNTSIRLSIVSTLALARAFLAENLPDLALIDLMLPDGKGTELLCADREQATFPAVLLTASGDEQTAVEAMKSGALDYLVKGAATFCELPHVVERILREWDNIIRRRKAEEELRTREEHLRLALEAGDMGTWEWDIRSDEFCWDAAQRRLFGVSEGENPSREAIWQILHPEDRDRSAEKVARAMESGELRDEIRILRPDGTVRWIGSTGRVHRDGEGRPLRMLGVNFDITERKRSEVERERLLAEQEATLSAIADAVVSYDPNGTIRHMNPAAERMFGYSLEERRMPIAERVSRFRIETSDGGPFPLEDVMRRVAAGESVKGAVVVVRRAGQPERWLSGSAAPIYTADGRRLGVVGTYTDITCLHELQKERDLYLHTISHDLRTPLTVIQGYGQLLRESLSKGTVGASLGLMCDEMLKGAQRMKRMIDTLVDVARLDGGQVEPKASALLLGSFVQQLVVRLEGLRLKGVLDAGRLTVEIPADLPPVLADPDLLERILLNLLTNAMKYSPPETPVRVEARLKGSEVEIAVIDQGAGIAPEDQARIFERFYRSQNIQRRDSVGLGLYITRKLVETHGGRIGIESEPGKGSTFFFTLPVSGAV
jgi:PAS domain S-box-containing protein